MGNTVVRCADAQAAAADRNAFKLGPSGDGAMDAKAGGGGGDFAQQSGSTYDPTDERTRAALPPHMQPSSDQSMAFNPGTLEELHKKCKDVQPILFDGAKVMVQKGLSNHFQISHTLNMSAQQSGYRFGGTFVGTNQISPHEVFPVLIGDMDIDGNTMATIIHQFGKHVRCKIQSQIQQSKFSVFQASGEYRGHCSTTTLTCVNPDLLNGSSIFVAQYLRRVLPKWDLGLEMICQSGGPVPGGHHSALGYYARYNGDKCTTSAQVGSSGLHVCYYHKHNDDTQFGVEWETSLRSEESVATFAYQLEIPKAQTTFKASCDSQWTVAATLEKRLAPMPFTLALSGCINHAKAASKFGVGLIIG